MLNAYVTLVLLAAAGQGSYAVPPGSDWNCEDPTSQQEMNWCAAREYEAADQALNEQWSIVRAKMKARDASFEKYQPDGDGRPGHFESLLEAQRAWLTYRDAHCRVDGYSVRGGSLEPMLVAQCKTSLTKARTQELIELANSPD
ncbi:MAG: lysozyme inhibitor LprI family protein [Erythrobacter sp.]|uniref:lysozyme inhibitor LprI family protein n=1 Tax=Erythrobacter sp. TaxID=1042 RepID=UPI0026133ED6|nr:lysozyme inhibitor LprI family protein [Erythrobacter sp.]MDJ0977362.1 lysozyme inhibitor LprI family protein [Erythrobacter sp.]